MRPIRTVVTQPIPERSAFEYGVDLVKDAVTPVVAADLVALTLTVYNLDATVTLINGIDHVNILNTGRGVLNVVTGRLVVILNSADLVLVVPTAPYEKHINLLEGTYAGGIRAFRHEIEYVVVNLARVA